MPAFLRQKLCLGATAIALLGAVDTGTSAAESPHPRSQTCGLLPGEGAYNYVRVWNVGCAKAKKVANRAFKRLCSPRDKCSSSDPNADPVRGRARVGDWRCKLKFAWEFTRTRCEAPHKRFVQASGA